MHRWKFSALAAAACLTTALATTDASALTLGRLAVQSALGEPLRAEIEVPQITGAEADSLAAAIASPEVFRARGMDYNSVARQIQVQIERRADGTAVLRLSSIQAVNEPFVDLVLDASWHAGHVVRNYTVLLDPPVRSRPAPAVTAAAQTGNASPAVPVRPASTPARQAPAVAAAATDAPAPKADGGIKVQRGDTAGQIAQAHRPSGVSLDQMLVALMQHNPEAFSQGNVNRLKAGAVLDIPSREAALATSATEARQIIAAHSRDFNAARRRMAAQAPQATVSAAERSASGTVQAQVQDRASTAGTPDKLTLSKGALPAQAAADEKLAQQKQADDQSSRLNELQRNLAELGQVASSSAVATAPAGSAAATGSDTASAGVPSTLPAATSGEAAQPTPAADTAAEAPAQATPPAEAAPVAAAPAAPAKAAPAPAPAEPDLVDTLLENPMLPAAGGFLALLLGLLGVRSMQRRKAQAAAAAAGADSQLQPDSFFGNSGGQQVDTNNPSAEGGTTMAYSPSQLDAGGDVDPVAEADVYLAYGREDQAEEILKEALRNQPERLSVHLKLAELHAKRMDSQALEAAARQIQTLTQGQGPDWEHVQDLGRRLNPTLPLYQRTNHSPAFAQSLSDAATSAAAVATAATVSLAAEPTLPDAPAPLVVEPPAASPSEADYAALEPHWDAEPTAAKAAAAPTEPAAVPPLSSFDLDLSLPGNAYSGPDSTMPVSDTLLPEPSTFSTDDLSLDMDLGPADTPAPEATPASAPAAPVAVTAAPAPAIDLQDGGLDFDLSGLNLDLGPDAAPAPSATAPVVAEDPLATKLDLAEEFQAIGDSEGARSLIEEVMAEASGPLKTRAERLLAEIA